MLGACAGSQVRSFERAQASVGGSTGPNSKVGIGINLGLRVWSGERVGFANLAHGWCIAIAGSR